MQTITSSKTSINQVPMLHKWFVDNMRGGESLFCVLDYGCGKYNNAMDFLRLHGCTHVFGYDLFNRGEEDNTRAMYLLEHNTFDSVLVANVLNVINDEDARATVIQDALLGGTAYFSVYEGNRSGVGKETTRGWQENRKTADYMGEVGKYFTNVVRKGKVIIATK